MYRQAAPLCQQHSGLFGKICDSNLRLISKSHSPFLPDLKDKREQPGYCFGVLIVLSYFLVVVTFPLSLCFCLKVRREDVLIH